MKIIEKINSEKDFESITGGYSAVFGATNTLTVSKDEYEKLEEEGYIVDGKIKHSNVKDAVNFLNEEGFKGVCEHLCFMYLGYEAPEYANLIKD